MGLAVFPGRPGSSFKIWLSGCVFTLPGRLPFLVYSWVPVLGATLMSVWLLVREELTSVAQNVEGACAPCECLQSHVQYALTGDW